MCIVLKEGKNLVDYSTALKPALKCLPKHLPNTYNLLSEGDAKLLEILACSNKNSPMKTNRNMLICTLKSEARKYLTTIFFKLTYFRGIIFDFFYALHIMIYYIKLLS